jgi:hypothetical protein
VLLNVFSEGGGGGEGGFSASGNASVIGFDSGVSVMLDGVSVIEPAKGLPVEEP